MSAGPGEEEGFPLLSLPSVPLLRLLQLLPHPALLPLTASCSYLHATLHSEPSLWRALSLRPDVAADPATTQSLLGMLRRHGRHVRAVRMGHGEEEEMMASMQQVLALVAATCPNLRHLAISFLFAADDTNPLQLLVAACPQLTSLRIKVYDSHKGIDQLGRLSQLTHLHINLTNGSSSQDQLVTVFKQLHRLRKVTVGTVDYLPDDLPPKARFIGALVKANPALEEVVTDSWHGGVKVSPSDKKLLQKKGIKFEEVEFLGNSSDEDGGDESEGDDEDSDEEIEEGAENIGEEIEDSSLSADSKLFFMIIFVAAAILFKLIG